MSTNLWGGAGHNEVHTVLHHAGAGYCFQVTSPHVADDAKWHANANEWAKKHHATISDGPCPAQWGHELRKFHHGKTHVVIFSH